MYLTFLKKVNVQNLTVIVSNFIHFLLWCRDVFSASYACKPNLLMFPDRWMQFGPRSMAFAWLKCNNNALKTFWNFVVIRVLIVTYSDKCLAPISLRNIPYTTKVYLFCKFGEELFISIIDKIAQFGTCQIDKSWRHVISLRSVNHPMWL